MFGLLVSRTLGSGRGRVMYLVDLGADCGKHVVQLLVPVPVCQLRVPRKSSGGIETPHSGSAVKSKASVRGWQRRAKDHPHGKTSRSTEDTQEGVSSERQRLAPGRNQVARVHAAGTPRRNTMSECPAT